MIHTSFWLALLGSDCFSCRLGFCWSEKKIEWVQGFPRDRNPKNHYPCEWRGITCDQRSNWVVEVNLLWQDVSFGPSTVLWQRFIRARLDINWRNQSSSIHVLWSRIASTKLAASMYCGHCWKSLWRYGRSSLNNANPCRGKSRIQLWSFRNWQLQTICCQKKLRTAKHTMVLIMFSNAATCA